MTHARNVVFAITAMLAPQLGLTVSLKFSEGRNSLGASSHAMALPADKRAGWMKDFALLLAFYASHSKDALPYPGFDANDIMAQFTDMVNTSLAEINEKLTTLVDTVELEKKRLLFFRETADLSRIAHDLYLKRLSIILSKSQFQIADTLQTIQGVIDSLIPVGAPPPVKDAMLSLSACRDKFANATLMAESISKDERLAYADVKIIMPTINGTLHDALALGLTGTEKLDTAFAKLLNKVLGNLQLLPMPDVIVSTLGTVRKVAENTIHNVHTRFDDAITSLVEGVEV